MTKNLSGPTNMSPMHPWAPCAVSILIDEFIADKWIAPENRWKEISTIYKGQATVFRKDYIQTLDRIDAQAYAEGWVSRWIEDNVK